MMYRQGFRSGQGFTLGPLGFLIIANLLVFAATSFRPQLIDDILKFSGDRFSDQPWTIITSMFTHANVGHIFANMLTLYFYGSFLIGSVGEKKFFTVYLLGGLLGNILFMLLSPSASVIGASGAVFAVGGALVMLNPRLPVILFPIPIPLPLWIVVIGGFLIISPGIAWEAHLGGLLLGLGAGYLFKRNRGLRI